MHSTESEKIQMEKEKRSNGNGDISILALDDDPIVTAMLQSYFQKAGFRIDVENDPFVAIERIREGDYDILLLDYLMMPICGDKVVEQIRKFNREIFIILLTGKRSLVPPLQTIRELDIQGYYEKSNRLEQLELLIESCVKSIRQLRTIRNYQESTASLIEAIPHIYNLENIDIVGENILRTSMNLLGCQNGTLILNFSDGGAPEIRIIRAGNGIATIENQSFVTLVGKLRKGTNSEGQILETLLYDENNSVIGILGVELADTPTLHEVQLFQLFARQSSAALGNTLLMSKIRKSYMEMAQMIRLMVDAKDIYTRGHSDRVAYLSEKFALAMNKDKEFCERVRLAGLFHDIGKIAVPDEILLSNRALTESEFEIIKEHPRKSFDILSAVDHYKDIAHIVLEHHERIDGRGYPNGLKGEEISEEARIVSIADAFDAMLSIRTYNEAITFEEAREQLVKHKGTQFDADIVDFFIQWLEDWEQIEKELENCTKFL